MPGVVRVGVDTAGGIVTGNLAPTVFVNGSPIGVLYASVAPHGGGVHGSAIMVEASGTVFASGIAVCREGDMASCGHSATGSGSVSAGG
jgi:uncharacterized Zn-binding protein involved in type VI secretion